MEDLSIEELLSTIKYLRELFDERFPDFSSKSIRDIFMEKFYKDPFLGALLGLEQVRSLQDPTFRKVLEDRRKTNMNFIIMAKVIAMALKKKAAIAFEEDEIEYLEKFQTPDSFDITPIGWKGLSMEDFLLDVNEVEEILDIIDELNNFRFEIFKYRDFINALEKEKFFELEEKMKNFKQERNYLIEILNMVLNINEGFMPKINKLKTIRTKIDDFLTFQSKGIYYSIIGYSDSLCYKLLEFLDPLITRYDYKSNQLNDYLSHIKESLNYLGIIDGGRMIYVEEIDSFSKIINISREEVEEHIPLDIYEDIIKDTFAEIIGEPFTMVDWGGERSDLYTTRIRFNGEPITAAFQLKGKGTPGILTIKKLGKRGDQIQRLFEEPANIYLIQHIDAIDSQVLNSMKAHAFLKSQSGEKIYFGVIDGYDVARILKAYKSSLLE